MRYSIDVSHWNGVIDWRRARDEGGIRLAIMKATEGLNYVDPDFAANWAAAKGVMPRVAYHFFRANVNAIQQANKFWQIVGPNFTSSDYVALDFESYDGITPKSALMYALSFLYEIEKRVPASRIFIYSGYYTWAECGGEAITSASKYLLWLPQYPRDTIWYPSVFNAAAMNDLKARILDGRIKPKVPKPWTAPDVWQFTARCSPTYIPGHPLDKKVVDYNAVYMTPEDVPEVEVPITLYKVVPNAINVRKGPGTSYPWVRYAYIGEVMTIVNYDNPVNGYVQMTDGNWVYKTYLAKV